MNLKDVNSGDMIRELNKRGYREIVGSSPVYTLGDLDKKVEKYYNNIYYKDIAEHAHKSIVKDFLKRLTDDYINEGHK